MSRVAVSYYSSTGHGHGHGHARAEAVAEGAKHFAGRPTAGSGEQAA